MTRNIGFYLMITSVFDLWQEDHNNEEEKDRQLSLSPFPILMLQTSDDTINILKNTEKYCRSNGS